MYLLSTSQQILKAEVFNRDLHQDNCRRAMAISLKQLKQQIQDVQVYGSHTGRNYPLPGIVGASRFHRASREGEPPAPRTFNLVRSTETELIDYRTGEVRVTAPYGSILEKKMNRPFFHSTAEKFRSQFTANVANATIVRRSVAD